MGRLHVDIIQETSGILKKRAGGQHANANEWDARLCGTLSHLAPPQTHVQCATPIVRTCRVTYFGNVRMEGKYAEWKCIINKKLAEQV